MIFGQLGSRITRFARPGFIDRVAPWPEGFVANRARETGYGVFFATVFLLCQSPANSLAIDDIRVLSRLGEPLAAEVVVSPAAGEVLSRGCFSTMRTAGDLPDVGKVRLTLTRGLNSSVLTVRGSQPVREPLSEFMLQVKCPGVPTMVKTFLVMIDPPAVDSAVPSVSVAAPVTTAATITAVSQQRPTAESGLVRSAKRTPRTEAIQPGSRYTVRPGDTLSTIAASVAGRPDWSVWPIAQQIYASNPGAFLLGDPNVIAEGAVVFIPRLADVNFNAPGTGIRAAVPASVQNTPTAAAPAPAAATAQVPARATAVVTARAPVVAPSQASTAVAVPRPAPTATAPARIMPTPTIVAVSATPLPAMQLTTRLLDESQIKILQRAQGSPVTAVIVAADPVAAVPETPFPEPLSEPDRDSAVTGTRVVLQPVAPARSDTGIGWLWAIVGLLAGLLIGALTAVGVFRQNLRREYEHDLREGVQRHVHLDRLRTQQDQPLPSSSDTDQLPQVAAATMDLSAEEVPAVAVDDHTVEMSTVEGLDFELSPENKPANMIEPETLEMPGFTSDLDLNLSTETGMTGQHEVDFDLLEAAYSADYESEFVNTSVSDGPDVSETGNDAERFYHLENRDPTDEAPLPIELGADEMGSDESDEGDSKIVRFRR